MRRHALHDVVQRMSQLNLLAQQVIAAHHLAEFKAWQKQLVAYF
jgi:hypothetical protein